MKLTGITPILNVSDAPASIQWFAAIGWRAGFTYNLSGNDDPARQRLNPMSIAFAILCGVLALTPIVVADQASAPPTSLPPGLGAEYIAIEFRTDEGWDYDGRIEMPPLTKRNGFAVMLLGGGLGSPIDWEVPGMMTLDGKPTRDADTIAQALLDAGFGVMRWQSIRRGDLKRAKDPLMMDAPQYPQTVEQAKKAFAAFMDKKVVPADRVFLLGHSLGARRAAALMDEHSQIAGLVTLAGASLITADADAAKRIVAAAEEGGDASAERRERAVAKLMATTDEWIKPMHGVRDKAGQRAGVEVIAERKKPMLAIVGALDDPWCLHSYLVTAYLRRASHPDYTWRVYEGLGHQLGPERAEPVMHAEYGEIAKSRVGPIDPQVVRAILDWLKARAKPSPTSRKDRP